MRLYDQSVVRAFLQPASARKVFDPVEGLRPTGRVEGHQREQQI